MKNQNFTIVDIKNLLHNNIFNLAWTGKIYDEQTCDYKDLTIENISYKIKFLPEIISVYYENTYHTLIDACDEGMITKEILDQLQILR